MKSLILKRFLAVLSFAAFMIVIIVFILSPRLSPAFASEYVMYETGDVRLEVDDETCVIDFKRFTSMDHAYESPEGILYMIYDGIFIRGEFYNETSDVNELMSFDFKSKVIYSGSTVEGVTSWFLGSEGESVSFYYGVIDADNGSRYRVIDGNDYSVVYFYSDLPELTDYTTAWEPYKISDFTFSGDPSLLPEPGANDYSDDEDWRINDLVIENAVDPSDFWWWKFTDWFNRYGWIVFSSIAGGLIIVVSGLGFVLKGRR